MGPDQAQAGPAPPKVPPPEFAPSTNPITMPSPSAGQLAHAPAAPGPVAGPALLPAAPPLPTFPHAAPVNGAAAAHQNGAASQVPTPSPNLAQAQQQPRQLKRSFSALSTPVIYRASYSDVPVYEMDINGVSVMRRMSDGWLNATQILKVAGVEKGRRTRVLEREVAAGEHEKVQGGYGKYQGTWVSYPRGRDLCRQYGVEAVMLPLLQYEPVQNTPTKEQAMAAHRKRVYAGEREETAGTFFSNISSTATNALVAMTKANSSRASSFQRWSSHGNLQTAGPTNPVPNSQPDSSAEVPLEDTISSPIEPSRKRARTGSPDAHSLSGPSPLLGQANNSSPPVLPITHDPLPSPETEAARARQAALLDLFSADAAADELPPAGLLDPLSTLTSEELDTPLDKSANTALHWAATLGRVGFVRWLVGRGVDVFRGNVAGHTALMAAVAVSNCLDHGCFPELVETLSPLLDVQDRQGRTILHHIVVASGIRGRERSSRYYLEVLLEFLVRSLGAANPASAVAAAAAATAAAAPTSDSNSAPASTAASAPPAPLMRFLSVIVNAQDKAGNTALHLAARIGNVGIVQQLLEVLADPHIPNAHGLRPSDFGIPGHDPLPRGSGALPSTGAAAGAGTSASTSAAGAPTPDPAAASVADGAIRAVVSSFETFLLGTKHSLLAALGATQALIEERNREITGLSAQQRARAHRLAAARRASRDRAERASRIANLRRALVDGYTRLEMRRVQCGDAVAGAVLPPVRAVFVAEKQVQPPEVAAGFADRVLDENTAAAEAAEAAATAGAPGQARRRNGPLRAVLAAYTANNGMLAGTAAELKLQHGSVEATFRRLVALCTDLQEEDVDELLDRLVVAVESDGVGEGAVARVREFLRRVMG